MTIFQLKLDKEASWKNDSRIHLIFLILVLINSFSCKEKFGVYPYLDEWETFNETLLPKKEEFYSNLNMNDITDTNYMHAKKICKDFERKKLSEYHDFYLKSDILFLSDSFENWQNCI